MNSANTVLANQMMQGQGYATAGGGNAEGGDASAAAYGGESNANSIALSGDSTSDASSVALSGDSTSDSSSVALSGGSNSGATANIITNSVSNYKSRTPPVTTYPPYLPYFQHGGWGTLKAYFPNGPTADQAVYERVFDPDNPDDMKELRGVLRSLPYKGPLGALGGVIHGVRAVFGGPNNSYRAKGFEIANSLVRTKRPKGKPLMVLIDTNVDRNLLRQAGYAYVGKVGVEGDTSRNWDHVYDAAVAEALPWDVDVLLVSGGMKGVTIGKNTTFPMAGGAYAQTDFSISLFGGAARGITEGKGEAMVSAEAYRYWPEAAQRRSIPASFYDRFRARPAQLMQQQPPQTQPTVGKAVKEIPASAKQTGAPAPQAVAGKTTPPVAGRTAGKPQKEVPVSAKKEKGPAPGATAQKTLPGVAEEQAIGKARKQIPTSVGQVKVPVPQAKGHKALPGVSVSRQLLELSGFRPGQVQYMTVK